MGNHRFSPPTGTNLAKISVWIPELETKANCCVLKNAAPRNILIDLGYVRNP